MNVNAFRSKRVIITIQVGANRYKALQIFFGRDWSLYVSFPYFRHREGILAAATIPGNGQTTSQVNLASAGKVTSHLVKYSHHPDGRAHFSQHGKVRTEIRRQSIPLDRQYGHIFSVLIQGIEGFDKADDNKVAGSSSKRTVIAFQFESLPKPGAIKLVGRWYGLSSLPLGGELQPSVGPILTAQHPDERQQNGFLLASPYSNAQHVLFITCESIPGLGLEPELLTFYGGFDPRDLMDDITKEAGFLAFIYPASDFEKLKKTIGTVDFAGGAGAGLDVRK
jgi:hypothetical protein